MNDTTHDDHAWFQDQLPIAQIAGLSPEDQARFDIHAAQCPTCAASLHNFRDQDNRLAQLFTSAYPAPGLEDRIIQRLRTTPSRRRINIPAPLRLAVSGVAAAVVLGAFGYVVNQTIQQNRLPAVVAIADQVKTASNLRQLGQAISLYYKDDRRYTNPISAAQPTDMVRTGLALGPITRDQRGEININSASKDMLRRMNEYPTQTMTDSVLLPTDNEAQAVNGWTDGKKLEGRTSGDATSALKAPTYFANPLKSISKDNMAGFTTTPVSEKTQLGPDLNKSSTGTLILNGSNRFADKTETTVGRAGIIETNDGKKDTGRVELRGSDEPGHGANTKAGGEPQQNLSFKPVALGWLADKSGLADRESLKDSQKQRAGEETKLELGGQVAELSYKIQDAPAAPAQIAAANNPQPSPEEPSAPQISLRKVIRNGVMEFEVDRFDSAFAIISKLATENAGYVGTTQSEKLPNGKVKGSVTVRVPPDRLDTFVLQLRGIGDLKSQKLEAQDISKQYSDLESELKADRAMEERLLEIIKSGKGEIKDLLAAEKELAVWRGKIEKIVGEMKYYDNLVSLSTLNITVYEKDIKTPAAITETETVDAGIESTDVEKARADALDAIAKAKGRVIQSDLKQFDAGQYGATIVAEVSPDSAGPLLDHLKQLGKLARLDVQRHQSTENNASAAPGARIERKETHFNLSIYNLANVAPRQTSTINLAADDVERAYQSILSAATQSTGRVVTSALNRQKPEQTTAAASIEIPSDQAEAFTQKLQSTGELLKLSLSENPDTANVTASKRGFVLQIVSAASVTPREQTTLQLASPNVPAAPQTLLDAASAPGIRIVTSQLNESDPQNISATVDLEVRRDALATIDKTLSSLGDTLARSSTRSPDTENTTDSKVHLSITLVSADRIPPRETTTLGIEVSDPESALNDLVKLSNDSNGRVIASNLSRERTGQTVAHLILDIPLSKSPEILDHTKNLGTVRVIESAKDAQVPQGPLARSRLDITLATTNAILTPDHGLASALRQGLSTSITGLLWSFEMIVVGLCFVGPWAVLLYASWRLLRRRKPKVLS